MTFFNWSGSNGTEIVSGYIYIYFIFTIVSTALTVMAWWFFVVYRPARHKKSKSESEEEIPLTETERSDRKRPTYTRSVLKRYLRKLHL